MANKLEAYIKLPYSVEVTPEQTTEGTPCYLASYPDLPGCMSHGDTPDEAIANLFEAKELYIKTLLEKGQDIPLPTSSSVAIWEVAGIEPEISEVNLQPFPTEVTPLESLEMDREGVSII